MSTARDLLAAGKLRDAAEALKQEVRAAPRDPKLRTFLFQVFCVQGQWDRALTQLSVAAEFDPLALPMAEAYRTLIRCELVRERVFAGKTTPTLFGHPLPWVPSLVQALQLLARGEYAAAAALRDDAFEAAEAVPGTAGELQFDWLADADPRLGPVLEAMLDGSYYWIPFQHVARLEIEAPVDLRDHVWMPATFTWINGGTAAGFIPTRYPGSASADDALALARRTEFTQAGPEEHGWALPLGQRMLTTGDTDLALQDIRELSLGTPPAPGDAAAADHPASDAPTPTA